MANRRYAPSLAQTPDSAKFSKHKLDSLDEDNEEYEASTFGGFSDYMRRKRLKLQNQDALTRARASENTPAVFAGMTIHINGYTKPGRVELWNLIVTHGGVYKQYLEGKTDVTHIVASNLTKKKQEEFSRYRVVRPDWLVDSVQAGKALPWTDMKYRVIDAGSNQKTLQHSSAKGMSLGDEHVNHSYKKVSSVNVGSLETKVSDKAAAIKSDTDPPKVDDSNEQISKAEPVESPTDSNDKSIAPPPPVTKSLFKDDSIDTAKVSEEPVPKSRPGTKTAKDPDFIQDYFRNSRLHHLSAWKANLRMKIDNLSKAQHPWTNQQPPPQLYVMHVDFDCFFAAVSSRGRKDLVGKSCAVTHGGNNSGEIASCNYEARKYGVKNGMWMKEAVKICPDIVSLPYDFDGYEAASDIFYETLLSLNAYVVEAVSIDEALVNITNLIPDGLIGSELEDVCMGLASRVRSTIRERTGVEVSIGIGSNVLQAKLAIKRAKPAGQFLLKSDNLRAVLDGFEVGSIPGVGWSTAKRLEEHFNVTRIEQLVDISESKLQEVFGPKTGTALSDASRGIDGTVVGDIVQRKLVSIEINWGIRLDTPTEVADYMHRVSEELCRKLKNVGFTSAKHLLVKIMRRSKTAPVEPPKFLGHGPCDKFNAGREIPTTGDPLIIAKYAIALLEGLDIPPEELRGIGVALTKLQAIGSAPQRSVSGYFDPLKQIEAPVNDTTNERQSIQSKKAVKFAEPKTPVKSTNSAIPGTQFIVPSQLDPKILAELPSPIRAKIKAQQELRSAPFDGNKDLYTIPSVSQIDPQDLAALPASVRHEILMHNRPSVSSSPSKNRNASISKFVVTTPSPKKSKAVDLKNGTRAVPRNLTKTFAKIPLHIQAPIISSSPSADIDREVLASLPEDIRKEILTADRNKRIVDAKKKRRDNQVHVVVDPSVPEAKPRRTLELPKQDVVPQQGELASETIEGLYKYLSNWHNEETDGPEEEDLLDFSAYIVTLIERDRDFERVESLLTWLNLIATRIDGNCAWMQAVLQLAQVANASLARSGLGQLKL